MKLHGTLKIINPRTLERWKQTGEYQKLIEEGYIYASGCGRFRLEICKCCKCKQNQEIPLKNKEVFNALKIYEALNNLELK